MLDAFIIDKIRRERDSREGERVPLHVEVPPEGPYDRHRDHRDYHDDPDDLEDDRQDRGVVIIDFTI